MIYPLKNQCNEEEPKPSQEENRKTENLFLTVCLLASVAASAQEKTVTGTVTDALGDPLIGATVLVQGTSNA